MKMLKMAAVAAAMIVGLGAAFPASAQGQNPELTQVCTGGKDGNYAKVGHMLQEQMKNGSEKVQVVFTRGSVQNLQMLLNAKGDKNGWCDVAIVQNDAVRNFFASQGEAKTSIARMQALYTEKVHFLCNREFAKENGLKRVPDIRGKANLKVAVGAVGSGNYETWKSLVAADKDYDKVAKDFIGGTEAKEAVADGTDVHCMLFTAGFNTPFMQDVTKNYADKVILLGFNDKDLDNAKDERNKPIYTMTEIPGGIYRAIQPSGITCLGSCSVNTAAVDAVLVYRKGWKDERPAAYSAMVESKNNIRSEVVRQFDPK